MKEPRRERDETTRFRRSKNETRDRVKATTLRRNGRTKKMMKY